MPRNCTVCQHQDRDGIDSRLVAGESHTALSALFRVSADAITRHSANHLPETLAKATEAGTVARADSLLDQLRDLQARTLKLLDQAEAEGKLTPALLAIGQARQNIELLAKLLGELDERPVVNLLVMPEWLAVRTTLLEALAPYPEARTAVAGRLTLLEVS